MSDAACFVIDLQLPVCSDYFICHWKTTSAGTQHHLGSAGGHVMFAVQFAEDCFPVG
jgi:hypothetical protein